MKKIFSVIIAIMILNMGCDAQSKNEKNPVVESKAAKVTFVELGSVNCIPCKKMQPIMDSIEQKYGDQVEVIFYDVWQADQKKYSKEYGISLIPTQVFLDENGKEFHRHQGFYPEAEIDEILRSKGLKPKTEI